MDAIVFTSNSGFTAEYASLLSQKTGLPMYSLKDSMGKVKQNSDIIYLGWLMAGVVKGLKKAQRRYNVHCVCGVGMAKGNSQMDDVRKTNNIPDELPLFLLQGGFDLSRLHGIYKFMMKTVKNTSEKKLRDKPDKSEEELDMLELMTSGGSRVSYENIAQVIDWCNSVNK